MMDVIVILIIAAILGAAVTYIIKAKKRGVKCIGCSSSGCCFGKKHKHSESSEHTQCECHTKR